MSRVFKKSDSFTPEKILPADSKGTPVWKDLVASKKTPAHFTPSTTDTSQTESTPPSAEANDKVNKEPIYETDISAPTHTPESMDENIENDPGPPEPEIEQIDIDAISKEAYNQGYQEALNNVEEDFTSSTKALVIACQEINHIRETILNNSMAEMQDLVLKIAEKILRCSVTTQQETIINTVEEALRQAVKSDEFVIKVNPDDFEIITTKSEEYISTLNGLENLIVKPDASINKGGCEVESSNCTVDATIDVQLEAIKNAIKNKQ